MKITAKRQTQEEKVRSESYHFLRTTWTDQDYEVTPISKTYTTVGRLLRERFLIKPVKNYAPKPLLPKIQFQSKEQEAILSKYYESKNSEEETNPVVMEPLIMLDGLEVRWEGIEAIPISWVARVDYIKGRNAQHIWGIRGSAGVVSVILRSDLLDNNTNVVYHSARMILTGFSEPRIFYSPKHHTKLESDYKPDLRNTLFWDPDLRLGAGKDTTLIFYNSDNQGTIRIRAEGITANGITVTGTAEYSVK